MENKNLEERKEEMLKNYGLKHVSREFDGTKKISEDDLNFILEIGRLAPSSYGLEPWKFVVIENEKIKEDVYKTTPRLENTLRKADKIIIILSRNSNHLRYSSNYINYVLRDVKRIPEELVTEIKSGIRTLQEREANSMYDTLSIYHWSWRQSYLALSSMIFAANEIGVSALPIEEYNEKQLEDVLVKHGALDKNDYSISVMLALGYGEGDLKTERIRRPMSEVLTRI